MIVMGTFVIFGATPHFERLILEGGLTTSNISELVSQSFYTLALGSILTIGWPYGIGITISPLFMSKDARETRHEITSQFS